MMNLLNEYASDKLTVAIMDDAHAADTAINVYLQNDYGAPPAVIRKVQACFGSPLDQVLAVIRCFVEAGVEHIVLCLVGDHDRMMGQLSSHRHELGLPLVGVINEKACHHLEARPPDKKFVPL